MPAQQDFYSLPKLRIALTSSAKILIPPFGDMVFHGRKENRSDSLMVGIRHLDPQYRSISNYAQTMAAQSQFEESNSRFSRALQVGVQPGAGIRPTSERRGAGNAEEFAGVVDRHAAEEAELRNFSRVGVV